MSKILVKQIEESLSQSDLVVAKKLLDQLVESEESLGLYTHYLIALYHIKMATYDLAVPHLLKICDSEESPYFLPKSYKLLAYSYLKQERYWDARAILEVLVEDFNADLDIKNMLAYTFFGLKQIEDASDLYREIIEEDKLNITARNGLASILSEIQENPQEAIDILEPYANKDPRILDTLGWSYLQLGDLKKSEEYLRAAFDKIPNHPEINKHLTVLISHL